MIRVPTVKYLLEGCVFALLAALSLPCFCVFFLFILKATLTKTVNISIMSIVVNLNEYELINETYFEWYELDANVESILIATFYL